ncbi:Vacuolar protein sorting-associated protein 70 [Parahypoxylon ruwenzoriense]
MRSVLASWDNEEYGLVGPTEFGEDHVEWLTENCVACRSLFLRLLVSHLTEVDINVDEATNGGNILGAYGSPLLTHVVRDVTNLVPSPATESKTIDKFGDAGFKKHLAMARLWSLLAVKLAGIPVLLFRASDYADALNMHVESLRRKGISGLVLKPLDISVSKFEVTMKAFDSSVYRAELDTSRRACTKATEVNKVYMKLERSFLRKEGGLPRRPWYKHLIFAPGLWAGYEGVASPNIAEWVLKVAEVIDRAYLIVDNAQLN